MVEVGQSTRKGHGFPTILLCCRDAFSICGVFGDAFDVCFCLDLKEEGMREWVLERDHYNGNIPRREDEFAQAFQQQRSKEL